MLTALNDCDGSHFTVNNKVFCIKNTNTIGSLPIAPHKENHPQDIVSMVAAWCKCYYKFTVLKEYFYT